MTKIWHADCIHVRPRLLLYKLSATAVINRHSRATAWTIVGCHTQRLS